MVKRTLTVTELEAQAALELPDREMLALINVVIIDLISLEEVAVQVPINVAANICGVSVGVLVQDLRGGPVDCSNENQQITVFR